MRDHLRLSCIQIAAQAAVLAAGLCLAAPAGAQGPCVEIRSERVDVVTSESTKKAKKLRDNELRVTFDLSADEVAKLRDGRLEIRCKLSASRRGKGQKGIGRGAVLPVISYIDVGSGSLSVVGPGLPGEGKVKTDASGQAEAVVPLDTTVLSDIASTGLEPFRLSLTLRDLGGKKADRIELRCAITSPPSECFQ